MSAYAALCEAQSVYRKRNTMKRESLEAAAVSLAEWHLFSNRHIAAITGLPASAVQKVARKWEKTGGRFTPEAIDPTLDLIRSRLRGAALDPAAVAAILELGVSTSFLARLTGIPQRSIARMAGRP